MTTALPMYANCELFIWYVRRSLKVALKESEVVALAVMDHWYLTWQAVGLPATFHVVGGIFCATLYVSQISSKCLGVSKQNLAHNKMNA